MCIRDRYSFLYSTSTLLGQLASLGADGRLYSELIHNPKIEVTFRDLFSFAPRSLLLFVSCLLFSCFHSALLGGLPGIVFIASALAIQPLLSNIVSIALAKSYFYVADIVTLLPAISRFAAIMPVVLLAEAYDQQIRIFQLYLLASALFYIAIGLYCFKIIMAMPLGCGNYSLPRPTGKPAETLYFAISTISALLPSSLVLPLVLFAKSKIMRDYAPSLALAMMIASFLLSLSQQYWLRLHMTEIAQNIVLAGGQILVVPRFSRPIANVAFMAASIIVLIIFLLPSFLVGEGVLNGYRYFQACLAYVSIYIVFSAILCPFALIYNRISDACSRAKFQALASTSAIIVQVTAANLNNLFLMCIGLSIYPIVLLCFLNSRLFKAKAMSRGSVGLI